MIKKQNGRMADLIAQHASSVRLKSCDNIGCIGCGICEKFKKWKINVWCGCALSEYI